jgi:hypothetical protein
VLPFSEYRQASKAIQSPLQVSVNLIIITLRRAKRLQGARPLPFPVATFPSLYGEPVGPPPPSSLVGAVPPNRRAALELLPVSESGQFDMPRFMSALALFQRVLPLFSVPRVPVAN